MCDSQDSLASADKNNAINCEPSTSQHGAIDQDPKVNLPDCDSSTAPGESSNHEQAKDKESIALPGYASSSLPDVTSACKNLNLGDVVDVAAQDNPGRTKNKNAKKKENLKRLQIPSTQEQQPSPVQQSSPRNVPLFQHALPPQPNNSNSVQLNVQDLFMRQIGPMYASPGSKYLENMTHHPQFQFMYRTQVLHLNQQSVSVPNSPMVHQGQRPASTRNPSTPLIYSEPNSPRYVLNALHHPLLNKTLVSQNNHHGQNASPSPKSHNKTRHRNRKAKKEQAESNSDDNIFDDYMSKEEVEAGLASKELVAGVLRINPKQFQHAYISGYDRSEQDIFIDGIKHRNRSLEGDVVVVQIIEVEDKKQEDSKDDEQINDKEKHNEQENQSKQKRGKVVYIKEFVHSRTCVGNLKLMADKNRQKALFIPRDHRIPRFNIPFTSWPDNFYTTAANYENTLFLAKITDWNNTRFAKGIIVSNIGQSGDMQSETKAILMQNDLDITPFGKEVRHLFPRLDFIIPEEEILKREDCRKLCIFSIDPSNCRDIDDAVSCRELNNGNYEVGVHISDVAHFLSENNILDDKVSEKATTIYLVEKAYHMLPDELCMLCSLFPGVDKLAFSVFWEITKEAKVISHRFAKTVIHSCAQLAYEHAQAILEDREDPSFPETYNGFYYKDIFNTVMAIGGLAAILRRKRFDHGALRIDQPKVSFNLNAVNGLPDSFCIYESKESHQLIEEFMLLANMSVAKRIFNDHPKIAFMRSHPPPSVHMLKQLAQSLETMGIQLNIDSAGDLHRSLLPYVGADSNDKGRAMVLNMLCAKPMTRAKYVCSDNCDIDDFRHYALNVPYYTHFTSPIRRYADIMVHRLLAASLHCREPPTWEVEKVRIIAAHCNKQKYNAKRAGELSTELYTLKYIELHSPLVTEAVVVDVREKFFDVIIIAMGLNRRIYFNNDFPATVNWIKNDVGPKLSVMEVTWPKTDDLPEVKHVIQVFSVLTVEMHKGDSLVKVETKLARPKPH